MHHFAQKKDVQQLYVRNHYFALYTGGKANFLIAAQCPGEFYEAMDSTRIRTKYSEKCSGRTKGMVLIHREVICKRLTRSLG